MPRSASIKCVDRVARGLNNAVQPRAAPSSAAPITFGFLIILGKKNRTEVRYAVWRRSAHVVADTHGMMMVHFGVAHLVMIRGGDGGQRRSQRGAKHQGGQAGERLDNGFHGLTLYR